MGVVGKKVNILGCHEQCSEHVPPQAVFEPPAYMDSAALLGPKEPQISYPWPLNENVLKANKSQEEYHLAMEKSLLLPEEVGRMGQRREGINIILAMVVGLGWWKS